MPLAMLVAIVTFLSYMLNKAPTTEDGTASVFFWIFYLSTCLMLLTLCTSVLHGPLGIPTGASQH